MATISQVQINGTTYEIADATARDDIASIGTEVSTSYTGTNYITMVADNTYTAFPMSTNMTLSSGIWIVDGHFSAETIAANKYYGSAITTSSENVRLENSTVHVNGNTSSAATVFWNLTRIIATSGEETLSFLSKGTANSNHRFWANAARIK